MIGERIREFEIVSELGVGGYGAVYKAHDTTVDRDVAIKIILPKYADDPEFKQRFESEARLVAQLENPRIVPLYTYWQDERGAFLVMRLIRGGSLRRIMTKQEALSLPQTIRIMSDIAEALAVAHENDVVHRDLKPENILVDERGNAYLTDFGIAKQRNASLSLTGTDVIVGTLAYISPEQIQNMDVLPQSDIYAFGIMLYEMLVGKHPFQANNAAAILMKHMQQPVPSLQDERPDLPPALDDIIAKATAKEAAARYATTLEMMEALEVVANESQIQTRTEPLKIQARRKPATPEERNRFAMLDNIRTFWIQGVLENSLHDAALIELGFNPEQGRVDNPWDTIIRTPSGEEANASKNILDVYDRMNGKFLILGDPGSGKTTSLLVLARELLHRARVDNQHPIPVILNLSSWGEKRLPLVEWIIEELSNKYQVPHKIAGQWVTDEDILLLLDGLDEVAEDVREFCIDAINTYREEHGFVDVIVCSRTKDYDELEGKLRLNGAIVIQPLDDVQIVVYLQLLGPEVSAVRALITIDAQMRELAKSPLMLSIMILAYRNKTAGEMPEIDDVETQRQHLFEVYVNRMFERRVSETYMPQESRNYLSWLAKMMQAQANSVFHIESLQPIILPEAQRRGFYLRVNTLHIIITVMIWSIHAFLFASATGLSPYVLIPGFGILGGIWIGWMFSSNIQKFTYSHFVFGAIQGIALTLALIIAPDVPAWNVVSGLMWGIGTACYTYFGSHLSSRTGADRDSIPIMETRKFSLKNITPRFWLLLVITSIFQATGFLLAVTSQINTSFVIIATLLCLTELGGLIIASGIDTGEVSLRHRPNQGVWSTFRTSLIVSALLSVAVALGVILAVLPIVDARWQAIYIGLSPAIAYGGYGSWTVFGGVSVYRHWMLRQTLTNRRYLPYNLSRFLDYAADLILLRKVGGGYIFVHRYLLEYFADLNTETPTT